MKVQIFSDIHNDLRSLERVASVEADIYISAGDLVSWSRGLPECGEILRPLGGKLWVLPGNHESTEQMAAFCEEFGFQDFHGQTFEAAGYHVAGLGYSNPTPFNTPGEYTEEEIAAKLEPFSGLSPLVLICHAPPWETALDEVRTGLHAGSRAVGEFIEKHGPEYFFCGHIHEAAGQSVSLGKTRARNVGKAGYLLEI